MKKFFSKGNLKSIVGVVLLIALVIGIIALFASIFGSDTKRISSSSFAVGGLDVSGEYRETTKSLYSKEAFCCQGLKIEKAFESKSRYEVYYYREDYSFIGQTDMLTDHSYDKGNSFPNAMFARIVITPVLEADENLNFLNKGGYANDFNITVLKDQTFEAPTYSVFPNVKHDFGKSMSGSVYKHSVLSQSPYAYQNVEAFSNKAVKQISVPISGVKNHREDNVFTVFVIEKTGESSFKNIAEHKLVVPAGTFKTSLDEEALKNDNSFDELATAIWFTWDLNITLKENQTLAFGSSGDGAYMAYRVSTNHEQYNVYNNVLNGECKATNDYIYVDIKVLE